MNNYDYVVLIDENGQPYIAHSFKSRVSSGWGKVKGAGKRAYGAARTAGSKAHKYLMKVGEGAKAKYAYTQQEVDALLGRGKRAVGNAATSVKKAYGATKRAAINAADKLGIDDRIRFSKARESGVGVGEAARAYSETPLGKAEIGLGKAKETVKKYGNMTLGALKSAASTVREKAPEAFETVRSTARTVTNADKREAYNQAVAEYNKVKDVGGPAAVYWEAAVEEAKRDLDNSGVRSVAGKVGSSIGGVAKSVGSAAKSAAGKVKGAADTASEKITTAKAKSDLDKATRAYEKAKGTPDARQAYWDMMAAQQEYERVTGKKPPRSGKY